MSWHEYLTEDFTPFTLRVRYVYHAYSGEVNGRERCEVIDVFMGDKSIWYEMEWEATLGQNAHTAALVESLAEVALTDWHSKRSAARAA